MIEMASSVAQYPQQYHQKFYDYYSGFEALDEDFLCDEYSYSSSNSRKNSVPIGIKPSSRNSSTTDEPRFSEVQFGTIKREQVASVQHNFEQTLSDKLKDCRISEKTPKLDVDDFEFAAITFDFILSEDAEPQNNEPIETEEAAKNQSYESNDTIKTALRMGLRDFPTLQI